MKRVVVICLAMLMGMSFQAFGEIKIKEGQWRLELGGFESFKKRAAQDDFYLTGSIEYEFPATDHAKLSFRGYPFFLYSGGDSVYGAGIGVAGRVYQHAEKYDGLFGELGVSALWQSREFSGSNTRFNFLSEAGIGYKFPDTNWHMTLKIQHLSNANLGSENSGINGVGIAAGYTFGSRK